MASSVKPVGDLGEILTLVFLRKRIPQASWVGSSNLGYDIVVPFPDGEMFQKPTAISVKTRKKMEGNGNPSKQTEVPKNASRPPEERLGLLGRINAL